MGRKDTPFVDCHAELLKAKHYMNGRFDPTLISVPDGEFVDSVSNPVDFLVPKVMDSTVLERT